LSVTLPEVEVEGRQRVGSGEENEQILRKDREREREMWREIEIIKGRRYGTRQN